MAIARTADDAGAGGRTDGSAKVPRAALEKVSLAKEGKLLLRNHVCVRPYVGARHLIDIRAPARTPIGMENAPLH